MIGQIHAELLLNEDQKLHDTQGIEAQFEQIGVVFRPGVGRRGDQRIENVVSEFSRIVMLEGQPSATPAPCILSLLGPREHNAALT